MVRLIYSLAVSCVLVCGLSAVADEDSVEKRLSAAKAAYEAKMDKLRKAVGEAFDAREQAARKEGNKTLLDQIKVDRKAFDEEEVLPSPLPRPLQAGLAAARAGMEAAYKQAVKQHVQARNDELADGAAKALTAFQLATYDFNGSWQIAHSSGWRGARQVRGKQIIDIGGTRVAWKQDGSAITVTWPNQRWERLEINLADPDKLTGVNIDGLSVTWTRSKQRR